MIDENYLLENGVNYKKGIELLGDLETYNDMLSDWFKESQNKFEQLKLFKLRHDMPNYAISVHALKSDSKYFGFDKLAELSYNHEMKSKENNQDYVLNNFHELELEFFRISNVVETYLKSSSCLLHIFLKATLCFFIILIAILSAYFSEAIFLYS